MTDSFTAHKRITIKARELEINQSKFKVCATKSFNLKVDSFLTFPSRFLQCCCYLTAFEGH